MALKNIQYKQQSIHISYEILNPDAKYDIVFLHGWGSNKELMKGVFAPYLKQFRHIYIDLPGFGNSTNAIALETEDYANILERFFAETGVSKHMIVGHSFGGKVGLLLNPDVLVLIASAGIYVPKSLTVWAKIKLFKLLKIFGLASLRNRFVASDAKRLSEPMYQTFKNVVNEDFSQQFESYAGNALLCWGKQDSATPLHTAQTIASLVKKSRLVVYEGDHYFFMQNGDNVSKEIEKTFLESVSNN